MTSLQESWKRTEGHLLRAHQSAEAPPIDDFHEYLAHNELELAADVLTEFGDADETLPPGFWEALTDAYANMGLDRKAARCQLRTFEAKHGFVEARLTLVHTDAGGRLHPISDDYRPDWNIGNRTTSGDKQELNGARVTLEDARVIPPGGTGCVRLHPLLPEAWTALKPGTEIAMHEGSRVVGHAVVLRITLRQSA